jgi:hypothetical protein
MWASSYLQMKTARTIDVNIVEKARPKLTWKSIPGRFIQDIKANPFSAVAGLAVPLGVAALALYQSHVSAEQARQNLVLQHDLDMRLQAAQAERYAQAAQTDKTKQANPVIAAIGKTVGQAALSGLVSGASSMIGQRMTSKAPSASNAPSAPVQAQSM